MSGFESSEDAETSDHSLLGRLRGGDGDAALSLYMRYASRLIALATKQTPPDLAGRVDPEDVVQSVFRTFFRRASAGHYDVPEGEELWKLLLVIALNKVRSVGAFHRAEKRDVGKTLGIVNEGQFGEPVRDQELARQILELSIDEVIAKLPVSSGQIIRLRIEGHGMSEIAQRVKRSKRTVERVLQSFRADMLKEIEVV